MTALNQGASALFFFNAFDDYEECARRLTFYGLFTSANHVYSPKKRYYATRQLYHFVRRPLAWLEESARRYGDPFTARLPARITCSAPDKR